MPGAIYMYKIIKKYVQNHFEEIILKLLTYGQSDKGFLLTSKFCPQGVVCPYAGAIYCTCIKSLKMCLKSDFKEIILKLATNRQSDKFLMK